MAKLKELAEYVRSENAGPFWVTIDIFCSDKDSYTKIKNSPNISVKTVSELYGVDVDAVKRFDDDKINVIKLSFPRPLPSGHKYENDMHAGQQYIFLAETEV